jgi:hypothetical protein
MNMITINKHNLTHTNNNQNFVLKFAARSI